MSFFLGLKPGVGPVIKIMAHPSYDPLGTPNSHVGKFLFNSENAEIGYGDLEYPVTIPINTYPLAEGVDYDIPNSAAPKIRTTATGSLMGWGAVLRYFPNNIYPQKNAFPFIVRDASNWQQAWTMFNGKYKGDTSDRYTITRRGTGDPLAEMCVPVQTGAAWSVQAYPYVMPQSTGDTASSGRLGWVEAASKPALGTPRYAFYQLDLPVDSSPYPTVLPRAPVAGQNILRIDYARAKMSKSGFNVDTATADQLIFDSNKIPMKVIRASEVTINAGATEDVPLGAAYSPNILVDYLVKKSGAANMWIPAWPDTSAFNEFLNVEYRIIGSTMRLWNRSAVRVDVRYVVMAADDLGGSTGSAAVLETVAGSRFILRRPGSAGTRLRDTIIDSRLAYLPIVAQDWVPASSFVASDIAQVGPRMHTVTWSNTGFKPYVLARLARRHKTQTTKVVYQDFFGKWMERDNTFSNSTFMCRLTDTSARFYCTVVAGGREDAWALTQGFGQRLPLYETIGLRYYIFAIPTSL